MAQINLAPGTQYLAAARRRRRILYGLSLLLIVVIAGTWGILTFWEGRVTSELQTAQSSLASVEAEIARAGDQVERIQLFEGRLIALDTLLENRQSWTPLLAEIERLLPPPTIITSLDARFADDNVEVLGTTPSIDVVAQTFASLTNGPDRPTRFSAAEITSVTRNETQNEAGEITGVNYSFVATLTMTEALLAP